MHCWKLNEFSLCTDPASIEYCVVLMLKLYTIAFPKKVQCYARTRVIGRRLTTIIAPCYLRQKLLIASPSCFCHAVISTHRKRPTRSSAQAVILIVRALTSRAVWSQCCCPWPRWATTSDNDTELELHNNHQVLACESGDFTRWCCPSVYLSTGIRVLSLRQFVCLTVAWIIYTKTRFCQELAVPNVTAHPSTASALITVLLYNGPLCCSFNASIKGLITLYQLLSSTAVGLTKCNRNPVLAVSSIWYTRATH